MSNLPSSGQPGSMDALTVTREEFRQEMNRLLEYLAQALGGIPDAYDTQTVSPAAVVLQGAPKLLAAAAPPADDDSLRLPSTAWVRAFLAANIPSGFPPGFPAWWPATTPPTGWLKMNGALLNRTTYADLFAAIGTTWGAGDGSTTFALPDLRGEFVRGFTDGRAGVDAGRLFGSYQTDMYTTHTHNVSGWSAAVNNTPGAHFYNTNQFNTNAATSTPIGGNPGSETRPRNIALLPIIKF